MSLTDFDGGVPADSNVWKCRKCSKTKCSFDCYLETCYAVPRAIEGPERFRGQNVTPVDPNTLDWEEHTRVG